MAIFKFANCNRLPGRVAPWFSHGPTVRPGMWTTKNTWAIPLTSTTCASKGWEKLLGKMQLYVMKYIYVYHYLYHISNLYLSIDYIPRFYIHCAWLFFSKTCVQYVWCVYVHLPSIRTCILLCCRLIIDLSRESNLTTNLKQHRRIETNLCSSWRMSFDWGMVIQPVCGRKYGRLNWQKHIGFKSANMMMCVAQRILETT